MTGATLIAIARWHFLIRAQDIPIPLRRTVQSAFVGMFLYRTRFLGHTFALRGMA